MFGLPNSPHLIDVRIDDDFAVDPRLIPNSVRRSFKEVEVWGNEYHGKECVIICHKGLKLSEGVAAHLRIMGVKATALEGGFVGYTASKMPDVPRGLWVTRSRPKVDRIACPWLIRRFINREARFLYVKASEVLGVADKFNAIPYDIANVHYTHRGEGCTFDALLDDFGLHSPALDKLALIIRGADTDRLDLTPQSAGLLAFSLGLSHMYDDDNTQLEAGMAFYDAMYQFCLKDAGEKHSWKI
jgi:rhodanese-related sulfurtransferase